jgi:hypothetical protein
MSEPTHEIVIGVYQDSFVRGIRCLHTERGEVCAPDAETQAHPDFAETVYELCWNPEQPTAGQCFWEDYFFGMSDFYADNGDAPESLTLFTTPVTVVTEHPLVVREDPNGKSTFAIRGENGDHIGMELDGKYISDIELPLEFLVVHPVIWTVEQVQEILWTTEGEKRTLHPGDTQWDKYAALVTTA